MARTAVVAGTASAVSGRVQRRQQSKWAEQDQAQEPQPQAAPPPQAAPAGDPDDPVTQIERLAQLERQGMITPEEYTAMKGRILAG